MQPKGVSSGGSTTLEQEGLTDLLEQKNGINIQVRKLDQKLSIFKHIARENKQLTKVQGDERQRLVLQKTELVNEGLLLKTRINNINSRTIIGCMDKKETLLYTNSELQKIKKQINDLQTVLRTAILERV